MDEPKDPMALWVGTWTPKDVIDREVGRLESSTPDQPAREGAGERDSSRS
jgi:hypothetical protein